MKRSTFADNLDTTFQFSAEGLAPVDLRLVELKDNNAPDGYESFSLTFVGPAESVYPQALYDVSHESAGQTSMFIVPVARGEAGTQYEAVYNRKLTE